MQPPLSDSNDILNECRAVDQAIDEIEVRLERLKDLQSQYLAEINTNRQSLLRIQIDQTRDSVIATYRGLLTRVKNIKSQPESGDLGTAPQVGKVNRRLKSTFEKYQQVERIFRQESEKQIARQYRIVRPDASDSDVREAIENNVKIFSSALTQSGRRGEVNIVAEEVSRRHDGIRKIEEKIRELVQLFQDLETLVAEQGHAVTQIEQREDEIVGNIAEGNAELAGAVEKARATRRKKWWCLGIVGESHSFLCISKD